MIYLELAAAVLTYGFIGAGAAKAFHQWNQANHSTAPIYHAVCVGVLWPFVVLPFTCFRLGYWLMDRER